MTLTILLFAESFLGLIAGVYGIIAARAYRGGMLSSAITWIVVGQVTMSVGHIIMAMDMVYGRNTFTSIFGAPLGDILFRVVVIFSLASSIYGFYRLWATTKHNA